MKRKYYIVSIFLFLILTLAAHNTSNELLSSKPQSTETRAIIALNATVKVDNDWGTGYQMLVTVTNPTSVATTSWQVVFNLPTTRETINSLWNANYTKKGTQIIV